MGLAGVLAAIGKPLPAAQLLGWAQASFQRYGVRQDPAILKEYNHVLAAVRAQLDEATLNAAWAEGQAMTQEQAIAFALEETGK
jgi:hypothetical protein